MVGRAHSESNCGHVGVEVAVVNTDREAQFVTRCLSQEFKRVVVYGLTTGLQNSSQAFCPATS